MSMTYIILEGFTFLFYWVSDPFYFFKIVIEFLAYCKFKVKAGNFFHAWKTSSCLPCKYTLGVFSGIKKSNVWVIYIPHAQMSSAV